jgi:hypothetical protein
MSFLDLELAIMLPLILILQKLLSKTLSVLHKKKHQDFFDYPRESSLMSKFVHLQLLI